jgi:hypothetical protein
MKLMSYGIKTDLVVNFLTICLPVSAQDLFGVEFEGVIISGESSLTSIFVVDILKSRPQQENWGRKRVLEVASNL